MNSLKRTVHISGTSASHGVGTGNAWILQDEKVSVRPNKITDEEVTENLERFERALQDLNAEYEELLESAEGDSEDIIDAQIQILHDPELNKLIREKISEYHFETVYAIFSTFNEYIQMMDLANNIWASDRTIDIVAIRDQLIDSARESRRELHVPEGSIVFATELSPTVMIKLSRINISGIVLQKGGLTSHAVILSQSLGIPCVVGVKWKSLNITKKNHVLLDGDKGEVVIEPEPAEIEEFKYRKEREAERLHKLMKVASLPQKTNCGKSFTLRANVEFAEELPRISQYGARGVGLLRTETILFQKGNFDVNAQVEFYSRVLEASGNDSVTIRLFDAGGDKYLDDAEEESNPFLGWRGIRLLLHERKLLVNQIEAICHTSARFPGRIRVLIPMVTDVSEILSLKKIFTETLRNVREKGIDADEEMQIGIMVEVPAVALMAGKIAEHADFFSIGTNDLTQYTLAVDRGNDKISELFQPTHPAVWKLIRMTLDGARQHDIPVNVCGEMASIPGTAAVFIGMGIQELSMTTNAILPVKELLCRRSFSEMQLLSNRVNSADNVADVARLIDEFYAD